MATPVFCVNSPKITGRSAQRVLSVGKKLQYCSACPLLAFAGAAAAGVLAAAAAGAVAALAAGWAPPPELAGTLVGAAGAAPPPQAA
ncbi:MAG TPA: hypothetical protein VFC93_04525, partial [Chloroflexota bacterium]|nr:hypothetical protein [Chloroflexota bacterium]